MSRKLWTQAQVLSREAVKLTQTSDNKVLLEQFRDRYFYFMHSVCFGFLCVCVSCAHMRVVCVVCTYVCRVCRVQICTRDAQATYANMLVPVCAHMCARARVHAAHTHGRTACGAAVEYEAGLVPQACETDRCVMQRAEAGRQIQQK